MADDKKKYKYMEPMLEKINRNYISISEADKTRNNDILNALLSLMTEKMKEKDNLFKEMYSRVFYGGSFYDGLRVGKPDEFDLDLLLTLPKLTKPTLTTSNIPGYVHLKLEDMQSFYKQPSLAARYKGLDKLINAKDHYLDTLLVLRWMEKVVTLALNDFPKIDSWSVLDTYVGQVFVKIHKGGPAFTLEVKCKDICVDIDLVPCFIFGKDKWPKNGFAQNPIGFKPDFFIVPKPLKSDVGGSSRYWRLSFQEQERVLIDGKRMLKPTVKLLKKLRDRQGHKAIASYYLKTVLLWKVLEKRDEAFWDGPLSYVFMTILKDYYQYLDKGNIPYYWYKKNNLLKHIPQSSITNIANRIKVIIDNVERNLNNPNIIAKALLTTEEEEYDEVPETKDERRGCSII